MNLTTGGGDNGDSVLKPAEMGKVGMCHILSGNGYFTSAMS